MLQSGKKAYEISYALVRIGSKTTDPVYKEYLNRQALNLLDAAAREDHPAMRMASDAIEYLVKFGGDVGLMHVVNAETIIAELNALNVGIAGLEKPADSQPVNLDDIFAGQRPLFSASMPNPAKEVNPAKEINPAKESGKDDRDIDNGSIRAEIRQSAILDRIRQSGNCRLKDLQEVLPDISERTLRYDLQFLAEHDLIERVGIGGPSVFYRIKQEVHPQM